MKLRLLFVAMVALLVSGCMDTMMAVPQQQQLVALVQ